MNKKWIIIDYRKPSCRKNYISRSEAKMIRLLNWPLRWIDGHSILTVWLWRGSKWSLELRSWI